MCDVILCDVDMRCNEMLSKVISAHWMHVVPLFQCPPWALMLLDKVHLSHFSHVQPAWPGCTSSLHFFHGRSITSAYIAPASFTSAYIATRIQSIFLFNIRLHYTKSLSLRIEFCTFCAAGARLTSDIISTHPQLTHHPPSSPIWIHAGPYKALTMSTPQNKKMELLLTFWCDIIPFGSLVGLI